MKLIKYILGALSILGLFACLILYLIAPVIFNEIYINYLLISIQIISALLLVPFMLKSLKHFYPNSGLNKENENSNNLANAGKIESPNLINSLINVYSPKKWLEIFPLWALLLIMMSAIFPMYYFYLNFTSVLGIPDFINGKYVLTSRNSIISEITKEQYTNIKLYSMYLTISMSSYFFVFASCFYFFTKKDSPIQF